MWQHPLWWLIEAPRVTGPDPRLHNKSTAPGMKQVTNVFQEALCVRSMMRAVARLTFPPHQAAKPKPCASGSAFRYTRALEQCACECDPAINRNCDPDCVI